MASVKKMSQSATTKQVVASARAWAKANEKWLAGVHLRLTSRSALDYGLPDAAVETLTPFLSTRDGSSVSIWDSGDGHALVLLGSEGQNVWLASSIESFEANVRQK
jgi:hypothetical protein